MKNGSNPLLILSKSTDWDVWISLVFWFVVYVFGMHPDVCWGDGMGYTISVEQGFDWATNANSHFLYLNLNHLISLIPGWESAISVLRWNSVGWAIATLYLVYQIGKSWRGPWAGMVALHGLACSFTFWRHACIIEVYTMSSFFWVLGLYYLIGWKKGQFHLSRFCLVHALGLLVHIQLVLLFPLLLWFGFKKRNGEFFLSVLWYLIPVVVVLISIFYLKTNDLQSVFFDNAGEKMASNRLPSLLKSLYFIPILWTFLMAGPMVVFAATFPDWQNLKRLVHEEAGFILILSSILNLSFCFLFPEPGIHVFMLPSFIGFCLILGALVVQKWKEKTRYFARSMPVFQVVFYLALFFVADKSGKVPTSEETKWKGGIGYYLLPWANGNATSVLEKFEESKTNPAPAQLDWNLGQAREWRKINP